MHDNFKRGFYNFINWIVDKRLRSTLFFSGLAIHLERNLKALGSGSQKARRKSSGHELRPDHLDLSSGPSTTTNFDKQRRQSLQSLAKPQLTWRKTIGSGEEPDLKDLTDTFFNGAHNVEAAPNIVYTPFGLTKPSATMITTESGTNPIDPAKRQHATRERQATWPQWVQQPANGGCNVDVGDRYPNDAESRRRLLTNINEWLRFDFIIRRGMWRSRRLIISCSYFPCIHCFSFI